MIELKNAYVSVLHQGKPSYGGSQMWFDNKTLRRYGCGLIAAADLLLYLGIEKLPDMTVEKWANPNLAHKETAGGREGMSGKTENPEVCAYRKAGDGGKHICSEASYAVYIKRLRKHFTVFPRLGMPGWLLGFQLWLYFLGKRRICKVWWGSSVRKRDVAIVKMLRADIPVILSIGPNFPFLWGKKKVRLYRKTEDGSFVYEQSTNAHYVTVTGMNRKWYRISSWGKEYYIDQREYAEYVRKHSLGLYSNICHIGR